MNKTMNETISNYKLKDSRVVTVMKYLHLLLLPLAFISIIGKNSYMQEYPVLMNIVSIYLLAFFFIQIPYAIYFRYKYNKESNERLNQFELENKV